MTQRYAIIKWVGGEDDGRITSGIPVDCIKGFDYDTYSSDDFDPDKSFVIEWRDSVKKPPNGWKLYDGLILDVSTSVRALEKKSRISDLPMSPRIPFGKKGESLPVHNSRGQNEPGGSGNSRTNSTIKRNLNEKSTVHNNLDTSSDEHDEGLSDNDATEKRSRPLQERNNNITPRLDSTRNSPERSGNIMEAIAELRALVRENLKQANNQQLPEDEPEMVELGAKGSGVRITPQQWQAATEQSTFTAMAISLVMSTFNLNELLVSNVKGGKSKIKQPEENPPRHQALNRNKLDAIAVSVKRRFKDKFKTSDMNRAINTKLSALRREERRKDATDENQRGGE